MKVVVFGATGKTGQHVLRTALTQGHEVTAFGRSVDRAADHYTASNTGPNTRINRADIATALVDQLDDTTYSRSAISVTSQAPTGPASVNSGERR